MSPSTLRNRLLLSARHDRRWDGAAYALEVTRTIKRQFVLDGRGLIELEAEVFDHAVRVRGFLTGRC